MLDTIRISSMIHTMNTAASHMTVTNLRLPSEQLREVKAAAASHGMSFNEYVTHVLNDYDQKYRLGYVEKPDNKPHSIWNIARIAAPFDQSEGLLSDDDEAVYG